MKTMRIWGAAVICVVTFGVLAAGAEASSFTKAEAITIPATGPSGSGQGPGSPYPSTLDVAGLPGSVADVNVALMGFSHSCTSDLRFLLVGPVGQKTILLSNRGDHDCSNPDFVGGNVTLDDEASDYWPCGTARSGTFKPTAEDPSTDCSTPPIPFPSPAPPPPYPVALSAFDGTPPNGTWSLFVFDQYIGDDGSLAAWSLDILPTVSCAGKPATVGKNVGTASDDVLTGTPGPDVMIGLGGNDTINGLGGNDVICGGGGNDILRGGPGKDLLRGEAGRDKLKGQGGKDTCVGGAKPDAAKSCEKEKSV